MNNQPNIYRYLIYIFIKQLKCNKFFGYKHACALHNNFNNFCLTHVHFDKFEEFFDCIHQIYTHIKWI